MKKLDKFVKIAEEVMLNHLRVEGGYGYEFYHGLRVMKMSKEIAESEELKTERINKKCPSVGALFHDVGRVIDFDNHAEAGVKFVEQKISHLLDENELAIVSEIIMQHCEKKKGTIEAKILSDADCIDHVGVMDVWGMFHYSAFEKRDPAYTIRWFNKNKKWLRDHIKKVSFEVSRKEMRERIKIESKIMEEFEREEACRLIR